MNATDKAALRTAVETYERLTANGRALTAGQAAQRAELLRTMRTLTGYTGAKSGLKQARQLLSDIDPTKSRPRRVRYRGASAAAPAAAHPRPFDAPRVQSVVSSAVESSKRRH